MNYSVDGASGNTIRTNENGKETIIANFNAKLEKIITYTSANKSIKKYCLKFYNPEFIRTAEIDVKELDKFDYSSIDDSLLLSPTVSTAAKEMAFYIKSQSKNAEKELAIFFDKLGWHNIEGKHFYCAGDTILSIEPIDNFTIAEILSKKYHLEIDRNLSEVDSVKHALKMMDVDAPATPIIFITGLLGPMRQIILDADINTSCLLCVVAPTQYRKSECVKQLTQIYNRSQIHNSSGVSILRVSSSEYKIEELTDILKDSTFILDDLYKEPDNKKRKQNENRVRNLLRNFSDNSSRTTARSTFANNCQIIVTAEYLLESKTDIGRMMVLRLDNPINSQSLTECQKNPLALSTFYFFFIKWLCQHYDEIVLRMKTEFARFRDGAALHKVSYERLYEHSFLLRFVFDVFLEYSKSVLKKIDVEAYQSGFQNYVNLCLDQQSKVLNDISKSEVKVTNLSAELFEMLNSGMIILQKKGAACFIKGKKIFIKNSYFEKALREKHKQSFSAKHIAAYFRDRYISEVYDDKRPKKYNGKCYLVLNIEELKKDAATYNNATSQLFF